MSDHRLMVAGSGARLQPGNTRLVTLVGEAIWFKQLQID